MSQRNYPFDVPIKLSASAVSWAPMQLKWNNIWDKLPAEVLTKIEDAINDSADLILTEEDLNLIDDETWEKLYELIKTYV